MHLYTNLLLCCSMLLFCSRQGTIGLPINEQEETSTEFSIETSSITSDDLLFTTEKTMENVEMEQTTVESAQIERHVSSEENEESGDVEPKRNQKKPRPTPKPDEEDNDPQGSDGIINWPNGEQYKGTLVKGLPDGKGQMIWANGDQYTGGWRKGMRQGLGKLVFADGTVQQGTWNSNRIGK